jgi:8-oxo-dGTP pyrophosphatase MutT (NUDIX family)
MEYASAGCLFHDKTSFLAGFQRKQQRWTSFGGKKYSGETSFQTAMREVVEELFEIQLTHQTLAKLICTIPLSLPTHDGTYTYYKYEYNTIFEIIGVLEEDGYTSPLYKRLPTTLFELIQTRAFCESCEIQKISLFFVSDIHDMREVFDTFFLKDLVTLFL